VGPNVRQAPESRGKANKRTAILKAENGLDLRSRALARQYFEWLLPSLMFGYGTFRPILRCARMSVPGGGADIRRRRSRFDCGLFTAADDRCDIGVAANAQLREMRPDGVSNIVAGKMRVVFFCHPSVGMTQLFGDDRHWNALHGES
jgi:hypothetical protein